MLDGQVKGSTTVGSGKPHVGLVYYNYNPFRETAWRLAVGIPAASATELSISTSSLSNVEQLPESRQKSVPHSNEGLSPSKSLERQSARHRRVGSCRDEDEGIARSSEQDGALFPGATVHIDGRITAQAARSAAPTKEVSEPVVGCCILM